jgi:hypothetical protein
MDAYYFFNVFALESLVHMFIFCASWERGHIELGETVAGTNARLVLLLPRHASSTKSMSHINMESFTFTKKRFPIFIFILRCFVSNPATVNPHPNTGNIAAKLPCPIPFSAL